MISAISVAIQCDLLLKMKPPDARNKTSGTYPRDEVVSRVQCANIAVISGPMALMSTALTLVKSEI